MRRQRNFGCAHVPDMQIVHFRHAGGSKQIRLDACKVDMRRHRRERHSHRLTQQPPGAPEDIGDNRKAGERINHSKARPQHKQAGNRNACRYGCICQHMKIGPTNIEVMTSPLRKHRSRYAIDQDPHQRDEGDRHPSNRRRIKDALDRFECNAAQRQQQEQRIEKCRENCRTPIAIGKTVGRGTTSQRKTPRAKR